MIVLIEHIKDIEDGLRSDITEWQTILARGLKRYTNDPVSDIMRSRYVLREKVNEACDRLDLSRSTYSMYRMIAVNYFSILAVCEGLIKLKGEDE